MKDEKIPRKKTLSYRHSYWYLRYRGGGGVADGRRLSQAALQQLTAIWEPSLKKGKMSCTEKNGQINATIYKKVPFRKPILRLLYTLKKVLCCRTDNEQISNNRSRLAMLGRDAPWKRLGLQSNRKHYVRWQNHFVVYTRLCDFDGGRQTKLTMSLNLLRTASIYKADRWFDKLGCRAFFNIQTGGQMPPVLNFAPLSEEVLTPEKYPFLHRFSAMLSNNYCCHRVAMNGNPRVSLVKE